MEGCASCPLELEKLFDILKKKDEYEAWNIASRHSLTNSHSICPTCSGLLYLNQHYFFQCFNSYRVMRGNCVTVERCYTNISGRSGTLFENSDLSVSNILIMIWYYLEFEYPFAEFPEFFRVSANDISYWESLLSEIMLHHCVHNSSKLGGLNTVVTVHWTKLRNNRNEDYPWIVKGKWVFAGVTNDAQASFVQVLDDCPVNNLVPLIQQWIEPGGVVIFNKDRNFSQLIDLGYMCTPNWYLRQKKAPFRSKWIPFWKVFKRLCLRENFDRLLVESIFSFRWQDVCERFHVFLLAAAKLFPPKY